MDSVQQAMTFYAGPLLAGDARLRWTPGPREHYRNLLVQLLASACGILQKHGQHEDIVILYRQAIEREPLAETLYRPLMQALKNVGRVADIAEVYHRLCSALATEFKTLYRSLIAR
jgi:two-component SAPR family response regulator